MKRTHYKRLISIVVALLMTFGLVLPVNSIKARAAEGDKTFDIVEITDFHGTLLDTSNNQVGAVLADRVKKVESSNPDTIVIGGGDLYQGSAISNMLTGVPVQQVMSNLKMAVTALGNHEFDWGLNTITTKTMANASYSIICANLYYKGTAQRVFEPYKIITRDGIRIAFIGGITTDTPNIVMPANVADYDFKDVATEINSVAKDIKDNNLADVIIAVVHEGTGTTLTTGPIFDIAGKLTNVNAVFGGHSHTIVYSKASNGIPVYIGNCNGKGYIDAKMTVSASKAVTFPDPSSADYIALDNANGYKTTNPVVDPEAKAIIDAANAQVTPITSEVIGHTSTALTRTQDKMPYGSSYLGKWASEATRLTVGADVGMQNNGGLRIDIPAGDITVGTMWQFMPFDNTIYKLSMNKSQIKAVLEQAVMDGGKGIQVSGIKFTYDMTAPSGSRVTGITRSNGTPISDTEILTVATSDFMATGGDGFTALKSAGGSNPANDTHILLRDAFINNIRDNKLSDPSIIAPEGSLIVPVNVLSILATSDIHGNIYNYDYATGTAPSTGQGLAKVSTFVKSVRANIPNVMLIDDGDSIQGTPLAYYYDLIDTTLEYPMMKVMGAMKYDAWTLGNHEFNFGLTTLNRIIGDATKESINVLSANTYKDDGTNFVKPYITKTFTIGGKAVKVGILGLTTKCIPNWEDPAHYAGLHFNDLVDEAKKWVPVLRNNEKCDIVIVSAHSGEESAADVIPENQVKSIVANVPGIDAVVAGHAHSVLNDTSLTCTSTGKVVPVVEPGKYGNYVSEIDVKFDETGKITGLSTKNVKMDNTYPEDSVITTLAQPYQDQTIKYINTVIGSSTGEFKGAGQYVVPTAIMDLVNKVQMSAAGTQLSIAAPLSSSAYIPQNDITIKDIMSVYVYENFLFGVKMTGKQVKDWMEYSVRYYKQINDPSLVIDTNTDYKTLKDTVLNIPDYNLDQLYGATYDIDLTEPACTVDPVTGRVVSGNRIKNLRINGVPVKDTDIYTVAINNYRYNGGGGFMKAVGLSNTDPSLVTYDSAKALGDDGQVRSLMISYIKAKGTISPDCADSWKLYTTPVIATTGVILSNASLNIRLGNSQALTATVLPADATHKDVIWSSSNEKVATVKNGVVTAVGSGTATISVTTVYGGYTASAKIQVSMSCAGIILNHTELNMAAGRSKKLVAAFEPGSLKYKSFIWSSSDDSVATVKDGMVTAVGPGTATITVSTRDGKYQTKAVIKVTADKHAYVTAKSAA